MRFDEGKVSQSHEHNALYREHCLLLVRECSQGLEVEIAGPDAPMQRDVHETMTSAER